MALYIDKLKGKEVVYLEVAEKMLPYTNVYFADGSSVMTSYAISETMRRLEVSYCKKINQSQAINPKFAKIQGNQVNINDKIMTISRRKVAQFLSILLLFSNIVFAQTAVNDTLKTCNDEPARFSVFGNDSPQNKIRLSTFTQPSTGELVSLSNNGGFRYYWQSGVSSTSFQYKIKLIATGVESSYATVVLNGSAKLTLSGAYTNTTLTNLEGCIIKTSGTTTFDTGAKYTLEHYQYTELLPGTTIDATGGGVVIIKSK